MVKRFRRDDLYNFKIQMTNPQVSLKQVHDEVESIKKHNHDDVMVATSDLKQAALRQLPCGIAHAIGGPIACIYYSAKTQNLTPTLVGTAVGVVGLPLAFLDYGLTLCIGAPTAAAVLHISSSSEKRRRLGITMPEEADALMAKFSSF